MSDIFRICSYPYNYDDQIKPKDGLAGTSIKPVKPMLSACEYKIAT